MLAALKVFFAYSNHTDHLLTEAVSFRNYQDTPNRKLVQQLLWDLRSCSSNQDPVIGMVRG